MVSLHAAAVHPLSIGTFSGYLLLQIAELQCHCVLLVRSVSEGCQCLRLPAL